MERFPVGHVGHHILCHVHSGPSYSLSCPQWAFQILCHVNSGLQILCYVHSGRWSDSLPYPQGAIRFSAMAIWLPHTLPWPLWTSDALTWPLLTIRCSAVTTVDYQMFCRDHCGLSDVLPWPQWVIRFSAMAHKRLSGLSDVLPWPLWTIRCSAMTTVDYQILCQGSQ
jgi:hypothetical protein